MLQQLWEVANGRRTIDEFISRHGYLGPYAGNLRSRSWREDPQPLRRVCTTYRAVAEQDAPGCAEARQRARHTAATGLLLGSLPAYRRPAARALVRAAAHFIPLREVGKNSYLQAADATRAVLRALGAALAGQGVLQDADDVWFLTWTELRDGLPADLTGELVRRRKRFEEYLQLDIPPFCTGTPEPVTGAEADLTSGGVLQGIGASHGVVEGFARVIADPTADVEPLEPGEILVAAATDPSWTTLFVGAAAVVIDVGGNLSHGAIVARELGIPCVTNVRTATSRINSGDRLVVDGAQGTVTRVTDFGQE
jgi:pyruvate,water dikinase